MLVAQQQEARAAAALVQRTGAAYVAALAALAQERPTQERPAQARRDAAAIRAAAGSAFVAAADQMLRLFPDDPLSVGTLQGLEAARSRQADTANAGAPEHVVWF
jgi:hypothetical protein